MRLLRLASAIGAGLILVGEQSQSNASENWTYHDCVQDCRDNLPNDITLQQCINEKKCSQYPKPHRTYQECLKQCEVLAESSGQPLQQCLARYVCSQYPQK